ncbi:MAG: DHH family phosphoesterase [Lachnospiraceae bacterium]|nr:DHH family phosphoesterase [Lachnospiraceae bacterium]
MKTKFKAKYGGNLKMHWQWSVILALTLLILDAWLMWVDTKAGLIGIAFSALYFLAILWMYFHYKPRILRELVDFATRYGQVQKKILEEFEIPAALLEPDGKILWMNDRLYEVTGKTSGYRKSITTLFPEINRGSLPVTSWDKDVKIRYEENDYRVHIQRILLDDLLDDVELVERDGDNNYLYMVYLFDETDLNHYITENREQRPVVGLVYIDNYEEAMENVDEVHQSLLNVLVDRKINKYFANMDGLVKKLEKDKYLVVMSQKSLDVLQEDRFAILEGVKTINIGNDQGMTLSIGVGINGNGYPQNYEFARIAMEMALGRGGDQAVVKDNDKMAFFGGKSQRAEKSTRVKARVKAQALREIMTTKDNVVAMGHHITDMDSLGACIGVYRAAKMVGKDAHIVLGEENSSIRAWVKQFQESRDYEEDVFISHEKAMELVDNNTAVVVVDTNRPSMTECKEILYQTKTIVVVDHHRQTTEKIENAALSYIEPSASSACEMIAEILQYFEDGVRLKNREADCMYAGIIIDTNNFAAKTGVRTFEAAAYLRRSGADMTRVRKALRDDMDSYKARAEVVRHAETFMGNYAISICPAEGLECPNVVGAQAANELLNIIGVKASFVITEYDKRVFVSARSIDEVNVQIVMERLGGGGHINIAGAQLANMTVEEAVQKIKDVLTEMTEEGAI